MNRSRTARRTVASSILVGLSLAVLAGCQSSARHQYLTWNVAPELETPDQRWVDAQNEYAIMNSENIRMLRDDWRSIWYVDRPSRLTSYPNPY